MRENNEWWATSLASYVRLIENGPSTPLRIIRLFKYKEWTYSMVYHERAKRVEWWCGLYDVRTEISETFEKLESTFSLIKTGVLA